MKVLFVIVITLFIIASLFLVAGVFAFGAVFGAIENYPWLVLVALVLGALAFRAFMLHQDSSWENHPERRLEALVGAYQRGNLDPYDLMQAFIDVQNQLGLDRADYEQWLFEKRLLLEYREFF